MNLWSAYCIECGEIDKAQNGTLIDCVAKKHKQDNPKHTVLIAIKIYDQEED